MNRRAHRGFTLIEIMIAVGILAAVMAGISGLLIQQSLQSVKNETQRSLEDNGRLAMLDIMGAVRFAGYGISPLAAFDFDRYACTTPGTPNSCNGGGRDRADAPDEIVMSWRDLLFARDVNGITGSGPWTVTLDRALTQPLLSGRIMQMICRSDASQAAYLKLNADAAIGATTLTLAIVQTSDGYYPAVGPTDACFSLGATSKPGLFLIERRRYYIANDTTGMPSLFRERGRGGAELVQRGIEDLQLSYTISSPPTLTPASPNAGVTPPVSCAGVTGWVFGECVGTAGQPSHTATPTPTPDLPYDSIERYSGHPLNIRTVTVTVVARGTQNSPDGIGDSLPAIGNRAARAAGLYKRGIFSVSEQVPNTLQKVNFLPVIGSTGTGYNVGGG